MSVQRVARELLLPPIRHVLLLGMALITIAVLQNASNLLLVSFVGIYGTAALGLNLMLGLAGLLSIGQAAMMGLGAYGTALLVGHTGAPAALAVVAGTVVAGIASGLVTWMAIRVKSHYYVLTTVGIAEIILVVIDNQVSLTGGGNGIAVGRELAVGGLSVATPRSLAISTMIMLMLAWYVADQFKGARIGREAATIGSNEQLGTACGMSVARARIAVGVVGGLFAGAAGAMLASTLHFVGPQDFDLGTALLIVVMVVIGGMRSNAGVIAGAIVFTYISYGLLQLTALGPLVYGAAVIGVMMIAPGGLASMATSAWNRGAGLRSHTFTSRGRP